MGGARSRDCDRLGGGRRDLNGAVDLFGPLRPRPCLIFRHLRVGLGRIAFGNGGDRPPRAYGEKPAYGDRPKRAYGDKPARAYGDRPSYGDRPRKDYGDKKPAYGGDRPARFSRPKEYGEGPTPFKSELSLEVKKFLHLTTERGRYKDSRFLIEGAKNVADVVELSPEILHIVLVADKEKKPVPEVTATYFATEAFFRLDRVIGAVPGIVVADYFDRLALDRALDSIGDAERRLTAAMVGNGAAGAGAVEEWIKPRRSEVERIRAAIHEIAGSGLTLSKLSVAASLLGDLARR